MSKRNSKVPQTALNEPESICRRTNLTPKLYWPVYEWDWNFDSDLREIDWREFPGTEKITPSLQYAKAWRDTDKNSLRIWRNGDFWTEFFNSSEVYIVDKFYTEAEYRQVLHILKESKSLITNLRKLYVFCYDEFNELNKLRHFDNGNEQHLVIRIINLGCAEKPAYEIHDRFALMDGEIWHFGGTVGGVRPHLTAYSRGWPDHGDRFRAYLEKIIERQR